MLENFNTSTHLVEPKNSTTFHVKTTSRFCCFQQKMPSGLEFFTQNWLWLLFFPSPSCCNHPVEPPLAEGLQRAMLRPVRSDGLLRPAAGRPVTSRSRSGPRVPSSLREAAQDGVDVGKNAFLLAHGYVTLAR